MNISPTYTAWPWMKLTGGGANRWLPQSTMSRATAATVATNSADAAMRPSLIVGRCWSVWSAPAVLTSVGRSGLIGAVGRRLDGIERGKDAVQRGRIARVVEDRLQEGRSHLFGHQVGSVESESLGTRQGLGCAPRDVVRVVGHARVDRERATA